MHNCRCLWKIRVMKLKKNHSWSTYAKVKSERSLSFFLANFLLLVLMSICHGLDLSVYLVASSSKEKKPTKKFLKNSAEMVGVGLKSECSKQNEENIKFLWCAPFSDRQDTGSVCQQIVFSSCLCHQVFNFIFISGPDKLFSEKNMMDNLVEGVWDNLLQPQRKSKGFEKTNTTGHETSRQP